MTNRDIDATIMQMVVERWQKTAMIIAKSEEALRKAGVEATWEEIAERIAVLASQGDIENQGDLSLWRNSEVRLPQAPEGPP
ncbi:hypothetical protein MesoLj131c_09580 [Mesorhizobium sp. 131-3-5]|uniref:DUF3658 domain-containing protein n=1 Tax=Mesorhizobium sp. 131-3-5 TaxID=2744520 RepID=UPI0019265FC2|nr:DUF3658 domain-containing protein [Mesorhizobium sp. 131-3-5]BCH06700.1 hypothetical protein MesoLj131c_09580 [Mesorhizobium sp. 131-3-5]